MKAIKNSLLATALVLIVIGVLAIFLQPGPPDGVCVPANTPSSGFVDDESGCAISQESYAKIADYDSSPKPLRIVGLLLIVGGVAVAVVALVRRSRSPGSGSTA